MDTEAFTPEFFHIEDKLSGFQGGRLDSKSEYVLSLLEFEIQFHQIEHVHLCVVINERTKWAVKPDLWFTIQPE